MVSLHDFRSICEHFKLRDQPAFIFLVAGINVVHQHFPSPSRYIAQDNISGRAFDCLRLQSHETGDLGNPLRLLTMAPVHTTDMFDSTKWGLRVPKWCKVLGDICGTALRAVSPIAKRLSE